MCLLTTQPGGASANFDGEQQPTKQTQNRADPQSSVIEDTGLDDAGVSRGNKHSSTHASSRFSSPSVSALMQGGQSRQRRNDARAWPAGYVAMGGWGSRCSPTTLSKAGADQPLKRRPENDVVAFTWKL